MSTVPDYELAEDLEVSSRDQLRAMAHPLRSVILDLLLERAATVAELAGAIGRPKSTIAHHVNVLTAAGLLRVVRTRRVRAVDERWYGRSARLFHVGLIEPADRSAIGVSPLSEAAIEARPAHAADELRATLRHARIPAEHANEFWGRVLGLAQDFAKLPRAGTTVYGFVAGIYATEQPVLPDASPPETLRKSGPPSTP
jgi:DNA-binding transcriptional ArsR family regulator